MSACQAECRGFEPRHPLQFISKVIMRIPNIKPFEKYVGQVVTVEKSEHARERNGKKVYTSRVEVTENDPVIREIESLLAKESLLLRIWLPGSIGTMDFRPNRLNVHISEEPADSGVYQINRVDFG